MPPSSDFTFMSPPARNLAEITSFFTFGTASFPSFGQSNTEKYKVVVVGDSFRVTLPQDRGASGLAFVAYMASLFIFIHLPIAANRSTLSCGNVPSGLGPTFNR